MVSTTGHCSERRADRPSTLEAVTSLYVAAGGGGDALAAAIVHRALDDDGPAIIATYAWDRLSVDPLPGPRSAADFTGLEPIGRHNHAITASSASVPPSGSTLPLLAEDLDSTLVLLDPSEGARGMGAQLTELADICRAEQVTVLDVGGDALARGDEPGLRSPLADALTLAASTSLEVPVAVLVAGPGLDGELSEAQVLKITGVQPHLCLNRHDVEPFKAIFDWHPSEATALLAAAARGIRGRVEVRDAGLTVELTDNSAAVYRLPLGAAVDANALVRATANTTSLGGAEEVTRRVCGFSEIDYERAKCQRIASATATADRLDLDTAVRMFEQRASARGVDYTTFRRIAEAIGPPLVETSDLRKHLIATRPEGYDWPLWSLRSNHRAGHVPEVRAR